MSSNKCYFTTLEKVERYPDPEINRIAIGQVDGNNVVVGIDSKVGITGLLFYPDCILTDEFLSLSGLPEKNFSKKRIKVSRFKGVYSEALFVPLTKEEIFAYTGIEYNLGEPVIEEKIYKVYIPVIKASRSQSNQAGGKFKRGVLPLFPMHFDTQQFRSSIKEIKRKFDSGWSVSVSIKVHGTSARTGHVRVPKDFTLFEKAKINVLKFFKKDWKTFAAGIEERNYHIPGEYEIVNGSRRVILTQEKRDSDNGYHSISFRDKTSYFSKLLEKDVVVFYEIFGWESESAPIMAKGPNGFYDYGLSPGEFGIQVYRITINEEDLSPVKMEEYSISNLNLAPVQRITPIFDIDDCSWEEVFTAIMEAYESSRAHKAIIYIDEGTNARIRPYSHVNEGVVVRMDPPPGVNVPPVFYKLKTPEFYEEEGKIKAADLAKLEIEQE